MKNIGTIAAAGVIAVILLLYMCTYQVRFTEVAIKKTWGKADATPVTEAGLKFKWPSPIQQVVRYDKRIRVLNDTTEETRTADGDNLILTTYALWRIKDAAKFHTNFPAGEQAGKERLRGIIRTHKQAVTGKRRLSEFISTNAADRKLDDIEREMLELIRTDARQEYGIEVVQFGLKKLGLPESVTTAIFDKMKATEEAKAQKYITEGEAAATDIVARAHAAEDRIMAVARQKVVEIEAQAQRVIGEYYKEYEQYPELRMFLDKLRSMAEALTQNTTIFMDTSVPLTELFDPTARARVGRAAEMSDGAEKATPVGTTGGTSRGNDGTDGDIGGSGSPSHRTGSTTD